MSVEIGCSQRLSSCDKIFARKTIFCCAEIRRELCLISGPKPGLVRLRCPDYKNRRHGKLSSGEIHFCDNARPRTAANTEEKIQDSRWELFLSPTVQTRPSNNRLLSFHALQAMARWTTIWKRRGIQEHRCQLTGSTHGQRAFMRRGLRKLMQQYAKCEIGL